MSESSSSLDNVPQNKDQARNSKTTDKSASRLRRGIRNVLLAGLSLSPSVINDTNVSISKIKNPTPAVAPSPDFKSQSPDTLQPYSPQPSEQKENKELESPVDIIPEEELKERYGIKIFNLKGDVELGFRRGAEKDSMFQQLEKTRDSKETYIVLFNGPYLDPQFLTAEQKAELQDKADWDVLRSLSIGRLHAKEDAKKWFGDKRRDKQSEYRSLRQELEGKQSVLSQERYEVERQALEYQYAPFLGVPTDEDLINASEKTVGGNIGKYVTKNGKQMSRYYVFLAVKDTEKTRKFKVGNEEVEVLKPGFEIPDISYQLTPDPSQSYPSPDTLTIGKSHTTYPIRKGWTPGLMTGHELRHLRGSPHPQADLNLISDINSAYQNYKNNGDDSGFWIVFKTPKGPVITKNRTLDTKKTAMA